MANRWPSLPKTVRAPGGPITVRQVKAVKSDGQSCWGTWQPDTRVIRIERGAAPQYRWHTYFHELAHAWAHDSGLEELFTHEGIESLCQMLATARIQEMRGELSLDD